MREGARCLDRAYTPRTKHLSIKQVNYIKRNIKVREDED